MRSEKTELPLPEEWEMHGRREAWKVFREGFMMEVIVGRESVDLNLSCYTDRPAPTRLSAWLGNVKPKVKKVERGDYKDPFGKKVKRRPRPIIQEDRRRIKSAPKKTEKKPIQITFPDGKVKRYDSIVEAAERIGYSDSAVNGWLRGGGSKAGYKARYV